MLTAPAAFSDFQNRTATTQQIIVELTDGSSTWLFSNGSDFELTDGHIYPLIQSFSGITQSLDIFSKQWSVNVTQLILNNAPYKQNSSGTWVRLSDELSGIINNDATIYLLCGENVTALSDCLTVFSAKILDTLYYDEKTIRVTLHDESILNNVVLPQNKIGTTFADAPAGTFAQKIPLVYGDFNQDFIELDRTGTGLAVAFPTHWRRKEYVISDHILDALTDGYCVPKQTDEIAEFNSPTLAVNSSGRGRITSTGALTDVKLYPTHTTDDEYDTTPVDVTLDDAVDRNTTTSEQISTYDLGNGGNAKAIYMVGFDDQLLEDYKDDIHTKFKLSTHCDNNVSYNITTNKRRLYYFNDSIQGDKYFEENMALNDAYDDTSSWQTLPVEAPAAILSSDTETTGYSFVSSEPAFGVGDDLNDMSLNNVYTGSAAATWDVEIDAAATPDTFKWRKNAESYTTGVSITGTAQTLKEGVQVTFEDTTNHTAGDNWTFATHKGLNDISVGGAYTGTKDQTYIIRVAATGVNHNFCDVERDGVLIKDDNINTALSMTTSPRPLDDGITVAWAAATGHTIGDSWIIRAYAPKKKNSSYMMGLYAESNTTPPIDDWLFEVNEMRLLLQLHADSSWPVYAECKGLEYGTWIDSRSSNYASNAVIEDPAGIIESFLREIGVASSKIDLVAFISAENTSVKARINLFSDNELTVDEAIRQIAEQSTLAYIWSAAGKARAIPLNDTSPTTNRTIPYSHLVDGRITISQTSEIVNDIQINSRWQQEYDSFADRDNFTDATSQTTYGVRKYEANWPNIAGTSVTEVKDHYVDGANAIWIDAHNVIEIETFGFSNADLEIGDWIELDSTTCDPQIKPLGVSWSGKQFLVVELLQGANSTQIKAIELH